MLENDIQKGKPQVVYKDTASAISAFDVDGMVAYATDDERFIGRKQGVWQELGSGGGGGGGGSAYGDYVWHIKGTLTSASGVEMSFVAPRNMTIQRVSLYVETTGSPGSTIIDVNKNGSSIFPTSTKPTVAYDDPNNYDERIPDTTTVYSGDVIEVDIDSAATGAKSATVIVSTIISVPTFNEIAIEDLSSSGSAHSTGQQFVPGSLQVYYNGLRQEKTMFTEDLDYQGFTTLFSSGSADALTAQYLVSTETSAKYVQGRLTLESGVPVSTTDQTDKSTLYFTPMWGDSITLYHDSRWRTINFSETSLALGGLTASRPHDIFAYYSSGNLALEALAWTDDTNRATALTTQNGVYVKSGDATRLYLGTIYLDSTPYCQDTVLKRYVWNYYNRCLRSLKYYGSASHSYSTQTWRYWNNNSSAKVDCVIGISDRNVNIAVQSRLKNMGIVGIGLDGTDADAFSAYPRARNDGSDYIHSFGYYEFYPTIGYHFYTLLEYVLSGTASYEIANMTLDSEF